MIFINCFIFLIVVFIIRLFITKSHLNDMLRINNQYYKWMEDDKNNSAPNNNEFNILFKKVYGKRNSFVLTASQVAPNIISKTNVIQSFPSKNPMVVEPTMAILANLCDFYENQYRQNFKLSFWIENIIFLPQNILKYTGINEDAVSGKILNIIYWLSGIALSIFWKYIKSLI